MSDIVNDSDGSSDIFSMLTPDAANKGVTVASLIERIASLETQVRDLQLRPAVNTTDDALGPTTTRKNDNSELPKKQRKPTFPDPDYFNGVDRALYGPFRAKLLAKLAIDGEAIGGAYARLWYVYGRLQGDAAVHVLPWMNVYARDMEAVSDKTIKDFFEYVDLVYIERNVETKALRRIIRMRPVEGRSFHETLIEFKRLLLQTGSSSPADDMWKKACLEGGIDPELRFRAVCLAEKDDFDEYCLQLLRVADCLEDLKREKAENGNNDEEEEQEEEQEEEEQAPRKRARWVSAQEMQRRRAENRCYRCGGPSHYIAACRFLPPFSR